MITVACVLRSGGDYGPEYVDRLRDGVSAGLTKEHRFVCITDLPAWRKDITTWTTGPQLWPGWWSKIAVFTIAGPLIYLDLDTIITGSLDPLAQAVLLRKQKMWMLEGFRWLRGIKDRGRWASGVMAWRGDMRSIMDAFQWPEDVKRFGWDQSYIQERLKVEEITPAPVQDEIKVVSYRHHCKNGVPEGTDLVCFHGTPRPHSIGWKI